jgi:hypothetical protein
MTRAKEIIEKGIIVFNATTVSASIDKITTVKHVVDEVLLGKVVESVELWYEGCEQPMFILMEEYNDLINGKIVELHKGEVFILFKED